MTEDALVNTVRVPQPRLLEDTETMESLTHWWTQFRNYYRRDKYVGGFLVSTAKWNPSAVNMGFVDETDGLKRTKADVEQDFLAFMDTLASYMRYSYITERLKTTTKCIEDVKACLFKLYDAELSQDTFLDLAKMKKSGTETPHQFFEKLSSHVQRHLTKKNVKIDNFDSGDTGDKMTLSMMNVITLMWLEKMNPRLIDIIRLEFADELRNRSLYEIMPRIATLVPQLLQKGDLAAAVNRLSTEEANQEEGACSDFSQVNSSVLRFSGGQRSANGRGRHNFLTNNKFKKPDFGNKKVTCFHCQNLNKELRADFNTNHDPDKCFRKKSSIRLLEADEEDGEEERFDDDYENVQGDKIYNVYSNVKSSFQADTSPLQAGADPSFNNCLDFDVRRFLPKSNSCHDFPTSSFSDKLVDIPDLSTKIRRVRQSAQRLAVRKAPSPSVLAQIGGKDVTLTIDEGAELNVLNERIAIRENLEIIPTQSTATAAGNSNLKIVGQTKEDFILKVLTEKKIIPINLGRVLVVKDLGCDCLCGEPGKSDNNIITIPRNRLILFCFQGETHPVPYLSSSRSKYSVCRVSAAKTIFPEDTIKIQVPEKLSEESHVLISPKRGHECWYQPGVYNVKHGFIELSNVTKNPVNIQRSAQIGEIRDVVVNNRISRVWENTPDITQFHNSVTPPVDNKDHLEDIKIDPDNQLDKEIRDMIKDICTQYSDIITPRPGRYNGAWGNIDTKIDFITNPPENSKIYSPNYSPQMNEELAKKLDKLIQWGVLQRPEDIGVTVQFCSPSMIIPKTEPGEYRLVTDFSQLNSMIRKYPGKSPTIQEAKDAIAKAQYVTLLDLSNYFYQGGLAREDSRYLGITHPFKGTYCYVVEPQGLKNSSEHAYERIQRVFGDMVQTGRLTSMADGLYVLANTQEEMVVNLREVFRRVRESGMTLKPSKIEVCPKTTILFGWKVHNNEWIPTSHTTSSLSKSALPKTAKQIRGWLGAFKQFSSCVPQYSVLLSGLEKLHAGVESKDYINWTEETQKLFRKAQEATNSVEAITTPRPSDKLHSYSDFSQDAEAVGGRMILKRKEGDQDIIRLVGFYSAKLDPAKVRWNPCERESLACRLVLEHFAPYIRQSLHPVTHHTDNRPTVQAWHKSMKGAYSNSSRMGAFLTGLSALSVEMVYTPGKEMFTSDHASRHPIDCKETRCQVCSFNKEWSDIGENCSKVRSIKIEDIVAGREVIPYHQRKTWREMQDNDMVHVKLRGLIAAGGVPQKKKTRGPYTKLKYLHNLYLKGELKMEDDGMILVKARKAQGSLEDDAWAYSIPHSLYPGLAQALHIRLAHPSKGQLATVMNKHFYMPGYLAVLEEISANCLHCQSMKLLPKVLIPSQEPDINVFASRFSADVLERSSQRIMVVREELTQMVLTDSIPDQTATSLKESLIKLVTPFVSDQGTIVRTDGAAAFSRLASDAMDEDDVLHRAGIKLEIGRVTNKNKNSQAENAIKLLEKEILRYRPGLGHISSNDLVLITRQLNLRPNKSGFSPRELLLNRSWTNNSPLNLDDKALASTLSLNRRRQNQHQENHLLSKGHQKPEKTDLKTGDLVFLRSNPDKHRVRDLFTVVNVDKDFIDIKKTEGQFRSRSVKVRYQELIKAKTPSNSIEINQSENDDLDQSENEAIDQSEHDVETKPESNSQAKDNVMINVRPQREARTRARQRINDMKGMISRILSSDGAKYSWVYIPHSYDEQFDVIAIPSDPNFDLEWLFVNSDTEPDSSIELGERPDNMMDMDMTQPLPPHPDSSDSNQTEPRQGGSGINVSQSVPQLTSQSRKVLSRGQFSKPRAESFSSFQASKRQATSPRQRSPTKVSKSTITRRSQRPKSQHDYYDVVHKYDRDF